MSATTELLAALLPYAIDRRNEEGSFALYAEAMPFQLPDGTVFLAAFFERGQAGYLDRRAWMFLCQRCVGCAVVLLDACDLSDAERIARMEVVGWRRSPTGTGCVCGACAEAS